MRAARVTSLSGPGGLEVLEIGAPRRGRGETLVEVKTVAPAFPDLLLSEGRYQIRPELPFSPGSDFAGVVVEADAASEFSAGDRVAGCLSFGAAAEVLSVPGDRLYPLPDEISFEEGAAIPMNYLTAHFALVTRAGMKPGQRVMVLGATGGVGRASIQVAQGLGAEAIAVVSGPDREEAARESGAHHVVLRETIRDSVRDITEGQGVDIIVDVVGGDMTDPLRCLAPFGRVMAVGFASGEIPTVKVNRLLLTNTDVRGVESEYLWSQGLSRAAWDELMALARKGHIRPRVHRGGGLADYGSALESISARSVVGRIVLTAP